MDPSTASLAELSDKLGNVSLVKRTKQASTTILNIEYPAIGLMPEGAELHVEEPSLVAQRERPVPDPRTVGIYDTAIFVVLQTKASNPFAVRHSHDAVTNLFTAVEAVASEAGKALLQMVSYSIDDEKKVQRCFKLTTASGTFADIILSDSQWRNLLRKQFHHSWLAMLSSLVYRRSARAYYHVRDHLYRAYGDHALIVDEQAWKSRWNSQPPRSVRRLLYARLRMTSEHLVEDRMAVLLPCGHYNNIERVRDATKDSLAYSTFSCFECGCRALLPRDDQELMLRTERRRTTEYVHMMGEWRQLDAQVFGHPLQNPMPASALRCALAAALGSLRLPTWLCPPELGFLHFVETRAVFDELNNALEGMDDIVARSAQEMYEMLIDCVNLARFDGPYAALVVDGQLPPGWSDDMKRWMVRTVNLLSQRSCSNHHPDHVGFHKHGKNYYCGVQRPETLHAFEVAEELFSTDTITSMAKLTEMLTRTTIDQEEDLVL